MVEINTRIKELLPVIEAYKEGRLAGAELENKTSEIVVHDEFEKLDEKLQNRILLLDSWDIQNLSPGDLDDIIADLNEYLQKSISK